ncbi:MAG: TOBE domain-containing protein [Nevskiales bacterium]|nr:TOBE domain-containing protein [Nevskiales bacterium]
MSQECNRPQPRDPLRSGDDWIGHQRLRWLFDAAGFDVLPVREHEAASARGAVQEMNNLAGEPLAEWLEGDIGCGIRLTARGRRLSVALSVVREAEARLLEEFGGSFADDLRLLDRVTVRTSARNQFFARVETLSGGALQDHVVLRLPSGHRIVALITRSSVEALALGPGIDVVALIKAPSMRVVSAEGQAQPPQSVGGEVNALDGVVRSMSRDDCYTEVLVDIGADLSAVAVAATAEMPPIGIGQQVWLRFSTASVIVGVPA